MGVGVGRVSASVNGEDTVSLCGQSCLSTLGMNKNITRIALTGGPCAGKTTALAQIIEHFSDLGYLVYALPETPTLFSNASINFATPDRQGCDEVSDPDGGYLPGACPLCLPPRADYFRPRDDGYLELH